MQRNHRESEIIRRNWLENVYLMTFFIASIYLAARYLIKKYYKHSQNKLTTTQSKKATPTLSDTQKAKADKIRENKHAIDDEHTQVEESRQPEHGQNEPTQKAYRILTTPKHLRTETNMTVSTQDSKTKPDTKNQQKRAPKNKQEHIAINKIKPQQIAKTQNKPKLQDTSPGKIIKPNKIISTSKIIKIKESHSPVITEYLNNLNDRKKIIIVNQVLELFTASKDALLAIQDYQQVLLALRNSFRVLKNLHSKGSCIEGTDDLQPLLTTILDCIRPVEDVTAKTIMLTPYLIDILYNLHELGIQLKKEEADLISRALVFDSQLTVLSKQWLICARTGVAIQHSVQKICTEPFITNLNTNAIAELLYACFLHDANNDTEYQVNKTIVNNLLLRADTLCNQDNTLSTGNSEAYVIACSLFSGQDQKYANNNLREVKYLKFILEAIDYYQYQINPNIRRQLDIFISLNSETTISTQQRALFDYLSNKLQEHDITITLEAETPIGGYRLDIRLYNEKTKKIIDVEFDGRQHFYKNTDFTTSQIYKRESIARDACLLKNNIEVIRFIYNDITLDKHNRVIKTSYKVKSFIADIKNSTSLRASALSLC